MEDKTQISVREFTNMSERLERLASEVSLLTSIINNSGETIIFSLNESYCYTAFNELHRKEMKRIWDADINAGMNFLECIQDDEVRNLTKLHIDSALKGKTFSEIQYQNDNEVIYECNWNPVFQGQKVVGVTAYSRNITRLQHSEIQLQKLNRIYSVLSNINQAVVRIHNVSELYKEVCRIIIESGKFQMVWIGSVNFEKKIVEVVASNGIVGDYLDKINIDLNNDLRSSGPTGIAIKTGKSKISNNILDDGSMTPWINDALKYDYRSCASFPLKVFNSVTGSFTIYSNQIGFFEEDDINLLDRMANDISFALEYIETESGRRQTAESLWESSQMLKLVLDNMPAFVFWKDRNSVYLGCNYMFAANAGLNSPEEIIGLTDFDLPWKYTEAESYRVDDKSVMDTGISKINYEETQFTADGRSTYVRTSKIPLKNPEGEIIGILGTFEDITERKLVEKALRESEQKFRSLAESSPDNIIQYDLDCRAIYVNHNIEKALNSEVSSLIGKTPLEVAPYGAIGIQDYQSKLQQVIKTGQTDEMEVVVLNPSGTPETHHIIFVAERHHNGKIIGALAIGRDVTEQKRSEDEIRKLNLDLETRVLNRTKQLEDANKELEAFAYSVSHDLRAPLRGIDGFSMALLEDYHDKIDDQGNIYLNRVRSAAQRMAHLIDDMLSLSRISRTEMNIQKVNLSEMFREIAENLRGTQPERKINFVIQDGIIVNGDSRLLRIVLENLIENSLKFTSKHPTSRIEFGVNDQDKGQVYFIRDDGAGFDMNYSVKLFGAFQRLHNENEFPGTGIGLATSQRIIHRHGGKVWAEGEVEKGATIYFTLPELKT